MTRIEMIRPRIVIIGDSLALPRPEEGVRYDDTYPHLLGTWLEGFEVIARNRRANDSSLQARADNLSEDITCLEPDILIIHLGIVDCAPRLFSKTEQRIINVLPPVLRKPIIDFASRHRYLITRLFRKVYVDRAAFRANIERLVDAAADAGAVPIVVSIADTNESNKQRSYNLENNIRDYNEVLSEIAKRHGIGLVDVNAPDSADRLLPDGIHLTVNGNCLLAQSLRAAVLKIAGARG